MTGFNHAFTGVTLGLLLQEPLLVAPIALASHFVLDAVPHFGGHPMYEWGHKHFFKIIAFDGLLTIAGVTTAVLLMPHLTLAILTGVAFAMLPDVTLIHYYLRGKPKHWFHNFHLGIQWFERPPGLLVEGAYLVFITVPIISTLTS